MHNEVTWGLLIVAYLFLGGISAGAGILSGIASILGWSDKVKKAGAYLAPFPVMLGLLFLIFDLHRPLLFYQLLLNYNLSSVMAWGVIALFAFTPVSLIYAFALFKDYKGAIMKPLAIVNMILGLGVGAYTGLLLSTVATNPVWGSAIIPVLFTISALSTGICGTILVAGIGLKANSEELGKLAALDIVAIGAELLVIFILIASWYTNPQGAAAAGAVLGSYGMMFWGLVIILGLLLPLGILIYEVKAHGKAPQILPYVSATLALIGGFFLRYVIVYAGQTIFPFLGQY